MQFTFCSSLQLTVLSFVLMASSYVDRRQFHLLNVIVEKIYLSNQIASNHYLKLIKDIKQLQQRNPIVPKSESRIIKSDPIEYVTESVVESFLNFYQQLNSFFEYIQSVAQNDLRYLETLYNEEQNVCSYLRQLQFRIRNSQEKNEAHNSKSLNYEEFSLERLQKSHFEQTTSKVNLIKKQRLLKCFEMVQDQKTRNQPFCLAGNVRDEILKNLSAFLDQDKESHTLKDQNIKETDSKEVLS